MTGSDAFFDDIRALCRSAGNHVSRPTGQLPEWAAYAQRPGTAHFAPVSPKRLIIPVLFLPTDNPIHFAYNPPINVKPSQPGKNRRTPPMARLSPQQNRVLECRAKGLSYKETAEKLSISINTVKFHLRAILLRTSAHSSAEALYKLSYRSHGSR